MSRVQRFDFKKVSVNELSDRLKFILNEEITDLDNSPEYTDEAILRIAALAEGSVRVAITLLDKCLSYSHIINIDNVELVLGLTKQEYLFNLIEALNEKNSDKALRIAETINKESNSLVNILDELITILLNLLKFKLTDDYSFSNLSKETLDSMNNYTQEFINILLDRVFKFRQLTTEIDSSQLLNILVIEMSRG